MNLNERLRSPEQVFVIAIIDGENLRKGLGENETMPLLIRQLVTGRYNTRSLCAVSQVFRTTKVGLLRAA